MAPGESRGPFVLLMDKMSGQSFLSLRSGETSFSSTV